MKGVLVCKTCLTTNVKMFHLDTLANAYSELTGLECDDETTEYVCYECAALLLKYQQFRTKCLKANQVISEFVGKHCKDGQLDTMTMDRVWPEITENILNMIDRKLYNLESTIMKFEIKENIFNEFYDESKFDKNENKGPEQPIKIEIDDIEASKSKDEVEQYYDDQDESDGIESLHLEDITLDEDPKTFLVTKETENEKTKIKNKLDLSFMKEYITIVNLTPEEAKKEVLLRKESKNYKISNFKCDFCYRGFDLLNIYENHMKKHSKEAGKYNCEYCHSRFSKQMYLRCHITKSHTTKFSCKACPYICFFTNQAKDHMNRHKGKIYSCKECGQKFSMPHNLNRHMRVKHTSEIVCALCGSTLISERGLKLHINLLHNRKQTSRKVRCVKNVMYILQLKLLGRDIWCSRLNIVSNGCDVCGETYDSAHALKRHARIHTRKHDYYRKTKHIKENIDCTLCKKTLVGKREFDAHIKIEHSKMAAKLKKDYDDLSDMQYVCEVCGKRFKFPALLVYHQRKHTGERPYSCSVCGKDYRMPNQLRAHVQSHSSPHYKCHLCKKTFVYLNSLNKHIKSHLGIRPYKCEICKKAFPTNCEVKYHTQYVHEKVPWPKRDRSKRKKSARDPSPETS